jgi:hypothetical protein
MKMHLTFLPIIRASGIEPERQEALEHSLLSLAMSYV